MMHLVATEIHADYHVVKPFRLPFHSGSMLRGVLGRALRGIGCVNRCNTDCEFPATCLYARFFDPPVPMPLPHRFLRGQTRAPQPMIPLFPAPGSVFLRHGEMFSFGLRLLGPLRAGELDKVLAALEAVSDYAFGDEGGRVVLDRAVFQGSRESLIETENETDKAWSGRVGVVFETPVWLEMGDRLVERLEFRALFRAICRRLSILTALYGRTDDQDDREFARLDALADGISVVESSLQPMVWQRKSLARGREHRMQGLLGRVVFEGSHNEAFVPVLRLAEKTHIGKATSHGLGRMRVELR